ncbi:MAG TPA: hypothetical protein H9887_07540 [Candidatus Dorea intestinavium]|nr:hypothetical protein [Candidatus Dorea intestinavium]
MANNTVNQNLIVPEVYAGLVREKIAGKIKVAQTAKVISDLKGQKGETITSQFGLISAMLKILLLAQKWELLN